MLTRYDVIVRTETTEDKAGIELFRLYYNVRENVKKIEELRVYIDGEVLILGIDAYI